jgi:hypothetical protein
MVKKKKTSRNWSYKRTKNGWEVCLDGKSKGIVVKDGPAETPWRWKSLGSSGGLHYTRNEAAAALLIAYKESKNKPLDNDALAETCLDASLGQTVLD